MESVPFRASLLAAALVACPLPIAVSQSPTGLLVVNNDEWTLSDTGFGSAPDAAVFARNLASQFAPNGQDGKR